MNVLIVSQCSKNALVETRRIMDQFAERKGDRTWQTTITQQGLVTVRKLLRKTAKRNTAVACHWIKGANQSELLWIVGTLKGFNDQGTVPTNITARDILRSNDENGWHTAEAISLLAGIAGLFHDFGKANKLFQAKLKPKAKLRSEPYRHEWVSLRLFQAFVGEQSDQQWLENLLVISPDDEAAVLGRVMKDHPSSTSNPFRRLPPLAQAIGWLIVSHHRLPKYNGGANEPRIDSIDEWMTSSRFGPSWNSPQCDFDSWSGNDWLFVWRFDQGTPIRSQTWCAKAHSVAKRALKHSSLVSSNWLEDPFSSHLARLALMLADHCYSASQPVPTWQDKSYKAYANTDRQTKALKQKLDEHNVGVGHNAILLAKSLPKLRQTLPSITRHKGFKQRCKDEKYRWQDKAFDLAQGLRKRSGNQGFFGVNMASTGCGKTFANARIMYGLADEKLGCRFNVALGLRTLTLQTGDALQERLHLESDDLAVLIGSQAVSELHERSKQRDHLVDKNALRELTAEQAGSESAEKMFAEHQYIRYDGSLDDGHLRRWLELSPTLHKLLSAPVLISTIDHLMPATEGERGGKQIAPMLRLLTSDLVLDEPDDFDLGDLPALSRLVNWAGMLGSRLLLSSATLPPALVEGLFDAYVAGRNVFNAACGEAIAQPGVCCAWFDEFRVAQSDHVGLDGFAVAHEGFIQRRVKSLEAIQPLRHAELLTVTTTTRLEPDVASAMADTIHEGMHRLHTEHHQTHQASRKNVSIGLVRMANIRPMVAVAKQLLKRVPHPDFRVHFCIYHSQHPLLVRSKMEEQLDAALTRRVPEELWEIGAVKSVLKTCPEKNHVFVVFATAVAEVGRDHDYDWAIAEPSSMRSLIQLAGRIQRHRQQNPVSPNLLIFNKNFKALKGQEIAYSQPGFESHDFYLSSKDLADVLLAKQFRFISAIPRIQPRPQLDSKHNMVDLEHVRLAAEMFGSEQVNLYSSLWWRRKPTWCFELQRRKPFRLSAKDERFILYLEDETETPLFYSMDDSGEIKLDDVNRFLRISVDIGDRVQPWISNDPKELIEKIAESKEMELAEASKKFSQLSLRAGDERWLYHPWFGVHGANE